MTTDNHELSRAANEAVTCLGLIDGLAIDSYLGSLSHFNQDALETSLMSAQGLPSFDPAGYLIAKHAGSADAEVTRLSGPYDFGVAFAGALVRETINERQSDAQIPAVTDLGPVKTEHVDDYIAKSRKLPVGQLLRSEALPLPDGLVEAIKLFADRCRVVVMKGFNNDGYQDDVLRGALDYFRVVNILENPEAETAKRGLSHFMTSRLKRLSRPKQAAA